MRNLTEIFLKRHPTWSNKQANEFIMSHFGVHSRVMNITTEDRTIDDHIDFIIQEIISKNNLFQNRAISTLRSRQSEYREYVLGSTGCLILHASTSVDDYLILSLNEININKKCPSDIPPRVYLEDLKLLLRLLLEKLQKPFIFKVECDMSTIKVNKTKLVPKSFRSIKNSDVLGKFFVHINENTELFSVFKKPFNNPNSLLYKFEDYFSNKIFREDVGKITFNDFFQKIIQMPRYRNSSVVVLYVIITLLCDNQNIIKNPVQTDNEIQNSDVVTQFLELLTERLNTVRDIEVSLKISRLLSDGKPWYMIFFDGLNYCSDNSRRISYENDTEYSDFIENIRNRTFEHKIKGVVLTVSSFMKEFNEKLKDPNEPLYFYDLMLYSEFKEEIESEIQYDNYCMMVE